MSSFRDRILSLPESVSGAPMIIVLVDDDNQWFSEDTKHILRPTSASGRLLAEHAFGPSVGKCFSAVYSQVPRFCQSVGCCWIAWLPFESFVSSWFVSRELHGTLLILADARLTNILFERAPLVALVTHHT